MPISKEKKSRYPKDWRLRSRFVRLVRAKNRCEWCGAENGKPHPETGSKVVLTTAHVYDHNPEAASLLNLAALCQLCHNRHDAKIRAINRRIRKSSNYHFIIAAESTTVTCSCGKFFFTISDYDRHEKQEYRKRCVNQEQGTQLELDLDVKVSEAPVFCKKTRHT